MSMMDDGKIQVEFFEEFTQTKSEPPTCKRSSVSCVCVGGGGGGGGREVVCHVCVNV